MILPLLIMIHKNRAVHGLPMERFYAYYQISRQGYFQALNRFLQASPMVEKIKTMVREYRAKNDRRAGSRSLYYNLDIKGEFGIGVTKFENLMSTNQLTLVPLRTKVVTTKSCFQSWNYSNLSNGLVVNGLNQFVVGDLTYISIGKNRYFLFCLTDVYSARIVGFEVSTRMRKEEAYTAFCMWIRLRGEANLYQCIHHTDGGGQYFSKLYLKTVDDLNIRMSVAKNCLQNGYAEQKNGIIKNHLIPALDCAKRHSIYKELKRLIYIYNHQRKQEGLGWKSPVEFESSLGKMKNPPELTLHDHRTNSPSKKIGF